MYPLFLFHIVKCITVCRAKKILNYEIYNVDKQNYLPLSSYSQKSNQNWNVRLLVKTLKTERWNLFWVVTLELVSSWQTYNQ